MIRSYKHAIRTMLVGIACLNIGLVHSANGATIIGHWLTQSGNVIIDIASCGDKFCGTVTKVLANNAMDGSGPAKPGTEATVGMKILSDLVVTDEGEWRGHIFNRENGKTYDCILSMPSPQQLKVRAYVLISLIGKNQIWQRVNGSGN